MTAGVPLWLRPDWRRSVLALVFAGAGIALTLVAAGLALAVLAPAGVMPAWPGTLAAARLRIIGVARYATLGLIALVLTGLAMTGRCGRFRRASWGRISGLRGAMASRG